MPSIRICPATSPHRRSPIRFGGWLRESNRANRIADRSCTPPTCFTPSPGPAGRQERAGHRSQSRAGKVLALPRERVCDALWAPQLASPIERCHRNRTLLALGCRPGAIVMRSDGRRIAGGAAPRHAWRRAGLEGGLQVPVPRNGVIRSPILSTLAGRFRKLERA